MTESQMDVLKNQICKGFSDLQIQMFLTVCKEMNLNPITRQIYGILVGGKIQIQVSIDGLRLIAERSGNYRGQVGPYFCGQDGEWKELWLGDGPPVACKVGVLHKDFDQPLFAIVKFQAYAQNSPIWQKMPETMIAKVAEALALRKAFPQDLSGIYSTEEMGTALPAPAKEQLIQLSPPPPETTDWSEPQQTELLPTEVVTEGPSPDWQSYKIPFGQWQGKTITEVGISKCLDKVKWFEGQAKGQPLSGNALKFKEMCHQAIQMGQT